MAVQVKSVDIEGIAPAAQRKDKFGERSAVQRAATFRVHCHHPRATSRSRSPTGWCEPKQGDTYNGPESAGRRPAENPPLFDAHFHLRIESEDVEVVRPVAYRYIERAQGELTRPLVVEPPSRAAMVSSCHLVSERLAENG